MYLTGWIGMIALGAAASGDLWVEYEGGDGPGAGKHIVLVSGDEEYRSEEALPQLGKILSVRHGFTCTVLFAIDPESGEIDPNNRRNIPGLEALADADLMIIATRFRDLPDEQMKHIDEYVRAGKPIVGMRTATHAFNIQSSDTYKHYTWNAKGEHEGGFGRQILGETWIAHHGQHSREGTGGVVAPEAEGRPVVRGLEGAQIWGPTDVYRVRLPLPEGCEPVVLGQVLDGMTPDAKPVTNEKNDPMMPISWVSTYEGEDGSRGRVFTTTMGASTDLVAEGSRRMLINGVYWALGMEAQIPAEGTDVRVVGTYEPTPFGFDTYTPGIRPADHALAEQDHD